MKNGQYEAFSKTLDALVRVPHVEIKTKLEAEKVAKKRKKSKTSSASHV